MKTKEEIINQFWENRPHEERCYSQVLIEEAMQSHADQQLAEYKDAVHSKIMARFEIDYGSIHHEITVDAYTISGFVRKALDQVTPDKE